MKLIKKTVWLVATLPILGLSVAVGIANYLRWTRVPASDFFNVRSQLAAGRSAAFKWSLRGDICDALDYQLEVSDDQITPILCRQTLGLKEPVAHFIRRIALTIRPKDDGFVSVERAPTFFLETPVYFLLDLVTAAVLDGAGLPPEHGEPPPVSLNLDGLIINTRDALRVAEANGGKRFRQGVERVRVWAGIDYRKQWTVTYEKPTPVGYWRIIIGPDGRVMRKAFGDTAAALNTKPWLDKQSP
jgi:hypothetical protein